MPLLLLEWILFLCNLLLNKNLASKVKCEPNKCTFQDFLQIQKAKKKKKFKKQQLLVEGLFLTE